MSIYKGSQKIKDVYSREQNTNCLLNIPQDIKVELNNGTLTLKAGSKVYVPNGFEADGTTPKFDEVVIESDITGLGWAALTGMFFVSPNKKSLTFTGNSQIGSGSSHTLSGGNVWYDTTTNFIKRCNDGSSWTSGYSLPICIATSNGSSSTGQAGISSINQVFNGFGYIGSTVFVLPDVKGLIPNGRNEDGSLKNIERVVTSLIVRTLTNQNGDILVGSNLSNAIGLYSVTGFVSDEVNNINTNNQIIISRITATNGVITSFTPKSVEGYFKPASIAAIFKGSQRVYGKPTNTLARPFNPNDVAPLSTTQNIADKDLWVFTYTGADVTRRLYTSKADGSNQIALQDHINLSGYTGAKGSDMTIVNKGWKYWIDGGMENQGAYRMEDPDVEYLGDASYDRYAPKPNYTTGVIQSVNTVYYADKNVWVKIYSTRSDRAIYVGKTSDSVSIQVAHNGYGGYSADSSTIIFIPKGWYYKSTGSDHTRWLCEGE